MWTAIAAAALVLPATWIVLMVLAARLPPGLARELASLLPSCVTLVRRLRRDPRVPTSAKLAVAFAALWVLSPIDLIPEFLPIIGPSLRAAGLYFVGLDIIGDYCTEVNVTSPTGIQEIDRLNGVCLETKVLELVERKAAEAKSRR